MPATDDGDKTEAPTTRRRQEARRDGQVARSMDLSAAFVLLGAMVVLSFQGRQLINRLSALVGRGLQFDSTELSGTHAVKIADYCFSEGIWVVVPLLVALAVLALVANFLQVGFLLTGKPLKPNLNKLNPISGFRRLFSKRTAVKLLVDLSKVALIAYVAYATIRAEIDRIVSLASFGHGAILALAGDMALSLGIRLGLILLVLAILDFAFQRWQLEQDLRMTKQEVREELKRMEGDPQIKGRRRQVAIQLATQRMSAEVPKADVVVTNPTELAVAIRYSPDEMDAPRVVAKGGDYMAMQIRRIAQLHRVPIVQRKPLARALYASVEVGQEIPPKFYKAVAEILAYVYETSGRSKRLTGAASA